MNEIALVFGADRSLVGTLTLPSAATPNPIAFVLLNAGVIHRIGPHRVNVKLARHLAAQGFASLRFDLSGQGDSRSAPGAVNYAQQAVVDIRAAMDHLARTANVHRFAIAGICSGADHGWSTALVDPRVVGLCLLDGYTYPTAKTRWVRYQRRLKGPILSAILPWIGRRLRKLAEERRTAQDVQANTSGRPFLSQEDYARAMQALVDRGVQVHLLFSGSLLPQYNYPEQFKDAFAGHAFKDKVKAQYCPDLDHTLTPLGAQRELLARVGDWAASLK